jgi:type IV pilus assembly protein PilX
MMRYSIPYEWIRKTPLRQSGAILIVSLIILLLMTLIGITSLRTTTLEERMAGNMRDHMLAFEAAEAGLESAQQFIDSSVVSLGAFDSDGSDGLYDDTIPSDKTKSIWEVIDWTGSDGGNDNKAIIATAIGGIKTPPKYVIQHYGSIEIDVDKTNMSGYGQNTGAGQVQMFEITARGTGGSDNAVVILQATYGKLL